MSSPSVWEAKRPIWLSASVCVCAHGQRRKVLGLGDQSFPNNGPPCLQEQRGPCTRGRGGEDKDAIVPRDRSRAHLTAAPPIASPLRAAPQVSSVCPLGGDGVKGWEDRRHLLAGQMGSELWLKGNVCWHPLFKRKVVCVSNLNVWLTSYVCIVWIEAVRSNAINIHNLDLIEKCPPFSTI